MSAELFSEAECDYCVSAQSSVDHPLYRAQCKGCAVRALAQGPAFYSGSIEGGDAKPYRRALALVFGDEWRTGHQLVLDESYRIKRLRALERATT